VASLAMLSTALAEAMGAIFGYLAQKIRQANLKYSRDIAGERERERNT